MSSHYRAHLHPSSGHKSWAPCPGRLESHKLVLFHLRLGSCSPSSGLAREKLLAKCTFSSLCSRPMHWAIAPQLGTNLTSVGRFPMRDQMLFSPCDGREQITKEKNTFLAGISSRIQVFGGKEQFWHTLHISTTY